jgi:hypothetical protein
METQCFLCLRLARREEMPARIVLRVMRRMDGARWWLLFHSLPALSLFSSPFLPC